MLNIFIGYDTRQPLSLNVLANSIYRQSSKPVSITPLVIDQLPIKRTGLTPFTYSRFLAPYLCNYEGWSLFLDADIILNADIAELFKLADDKYTVMVSKNDKVKFERASVMLFNNAKCGILTPEYIEKAEGLHNIAWANEDEIGDLPREWNHLVGYDEPKPAKLIHYTQGIPEFIETDNCEYSKEWVAEKEKMVYVESWQNIMGSSVHAVECNGVRMPIYMFDLTQNQLKPAYHEKAKQLLDMYGKHISRPKNSSSR